MADPITTSVEVTSATSTSAALTSVTSTTVVPVRFFPTFTFAAQTLAAGVASAVSAARRRRRVPLSADGGLPRELDLGLVPHLESFWDFTNSAEPEWVERTVWVYVVGGAGFSKPTDASPLRTRRSPAASSGVAATVSVPRRIRTGSPTSSLGVSAALALGLLRRRRFPATSAGAASVSGLSRRIRKGSATTSAGSTNSTGTRSRMAANIIDASSVALTDSAGNIITGLY